MDIRNYNREAWDRQVEGGNEWTIPVSPQEVAEARSGRWRILLTPSRPVPRDWFPPLPGCRVLCLASGGGQQGPILAAAGAEVTVFENSPRQLEQDRLVADREGLSLRTVEGDMRDLSSFADGSFDLIVHPVSNLFVPNIAPVWREAHRVLVPGGSLLSGFANPASYLFETAQERGELVVAHALPFSEPESLPQEAIAQRQADGVPLEFSHTLEEQIGGQLAAGFLLAGFYEDRNPEGRRDVLEQYMATFMATRAIKPVPSELGGAPSSAQAEVDIPDPGRPVDFYDRLAPMYQLIYPDWEKSITRQAEMLNAIIREMWGGNVQTVLDVACGIGTQSIGLAGMGYRVTASDISSREIERARAEAAKRGLSIAFSVADMREAFDRHDGMFDVVVCCDNSLPHLLSDNDIRKALRQFHQCAAPGGGCLISVRDYEKEDLSGPQLRPNGIREEHGGTWSLIQRWEPDGNHYDLTMYVIEDRGLDTCATHVLRTRYYAITIPRLMDLMRETGFQNVTRMDDRFFQPVVLGTKPG